MYLCMHISYTVLQRKSTIVPVSDDSVAVRSQIIFMIANLKK